MAVEAMVEATNFLYLKRNILNNQKKKIETNKPRIMRERMTDR